ncbi:MAG TPA: hypothetical protein VF201_02095 [Nitrolancea sp.]
MPDPLDLAVVQAPPGSIYRVVPRIYDPFEPKPWELAGEDGTLGDRFDDPSGSPERATLIPLSQRFRVIYCATTPAGAFGETVARVRPKLSEIPGFVEIEADDEFPEPIDAYLRGLRDPLFPDRGVLPASWRLERQLYNTRLDPSLRFVDVGSPRTIETLRNVLSPLAVRLGLKDIDFSTVLGPMRAFTQECSRLIYEQTDHRGYPLFAGVRYESRLNVDWECWAIFHDRMVGHHMPGFPETITPDHPALCEVAAQYHLSIEIFQGMGHYLRP